MIDRIFEFLSQCVGLLQFWQVLDPYERGIVLRFGRYHRRLGPGLHWLIPFSVDRVLFDNVVPRTAHLGVQTLMTGDGVTVTVSAVITASICNIRRALLEVEGVDHALADSCTAAVARHVLGTTWDDLRTAGSDATLLNVCRTQALKYGLKIHRVQLADVSPCRALRIHGSDCAPRH